MCILRQRFAKDFVSDGGGKLRVLNVTYNHYDCVMLYWFTGRRARTNTVSIFNQKNE